MFPIFPGTIVVVLLLLHLSASVEYPWSHRALAGGRSIASRQKSLAIPLSALEKH
jgi:hypothetical protein